MRGGRAGEDGEIILCKSLGGGGCIHSLGGI